MVPDEHRERARNLDSRGLPGSLTPTVPCGRHADERDRHRRDPPAVAGSHRAAHRPYQHMHEAGTSSAGATRSHTPAVTVINAADVERIYCRGDGARERMDAPAPRLLQLTEYSTSTLRARLRAGRVPRARTSLSAGWRAFACALAFNRQ